MEDLKELEIKFHIDNIKRNISKMDDLQLDYDFDNIGLKEYLNQLKYFMSNIDNNILSINHKINKGA